MKIIEKKRITNEFKDILFNKLVVASFVTFDNFAKKEGVKYNPKELKAVCNTIEFKLIEQLNRLAIIHYRVCDLKNDWGRAGEQQCKVSLCRSVLGLSPEKVITQEHVEKFEEYIKSKLDEYELTDKPLSSVEFELANFKVTILGKEYALKEFDFVQSILTFVGSNKIIKSWSFGTTSYFLLGVGKLKKYGAYSVYYIDEEVARSCTVIAALAATNENFNILLRRESLETIFHQKWSQMLDPDHRPLLYNGGFRFSEGIKKHILKLNDVKSIPDLNSKKDAMVKQMRETVTYHELAHGIIDFEYIGEEVNSVINAAKIFEHQAFVPVTEYLAEFAPSHNKVKGPIQNMIEVAKKDIVRATQMYYLYLSDTWFYDTDENYMFDYTDLMAGMMVNFINDDKSIDFSGLSKQLSIKSVSTPETTNERLISLIKVYIENLKNVVRKQTFKLKAGDFVFDKIKTFTLENMGKEGLPVNDSFQSQKILWSRLFNYVGVFTEGLSECERVLDEFRLESRRIFMDTVYGEVVAKQYNYDLQSLIFDRLSQLGFDPEGN